MERWESKPTEMGGMVNWELRKRTQCAKKKKLFEKFGNDEGK